MRLNRALLQKELDRVKEEFTLAAFIGWQMGAGGKKRFGEYLNHLGLSDEGTLNNLGEKRDNTGALARMGIVPKKVE